MAGHSPGITKSTGKGPYVGCQVVTKLKGFVCLHASNPNQTWRLVRSKDDKGLFKEMVPSPETQVRLVLRPGSLGAFRGWVTQGKNHHYSWWLRETGLDFCLALQGCGQWGCSTSLGLELKCYWSLDVTFSLTKTLFLGSTDLRLRSQDCVMSTRIWGPKGFTIKGSDL